MAAASFAPSRSQAPTEDPIRALEENAREESLTRDFSGFEFDEWLRLRACSSIRELASLSRPQHTSA